MPKLLPAFQCVSLCKFGEDILTATELLQREDLQYSSFDLEI